MTDVSPYSVVETTFLSAGTACAARVYRPAADDPTPAVVMAHGLGGVRALRLYAYAERFAAAGYAVVVFDYRGFGESEGEPRQVLDIGMQHADWTAALQFAQSLDHVDPGKVVAWGTSFGGGHVLSIAARGAPVAAVIAQVPHVSGPLAVKATGIAAALRLAPFAMRDQLNALLGRDPVYVPLVGQPGELGLMTSPDAEAGLDRLITDSGQDAAVYRQDVAARIAMRIGFYSPGRMASTITCPTLVQIARKDAITPARIAEKVAASIDHSTVHVYDADHFEVYVEPLFRTVVADQLAFLAENVPVTAN